MEPRLTVSTNDAAIEAACAGFGITRLLSYQVASRLASGELVPILEAHDSPPWPVSVVYREGRGASVRVRAFVELLTSTLRADPRLR